MRFNALTVGELAHQTGLTIRTLRYYDEIGLLKPSLRTEGGYRVYTTTDLERLQQVLLLRQLGFSLAEVRHCLEDREFSPTEVIRLHIVRLREQIELQQSLCERLESIAAHIVTSNVSTDDFIRAIDVMIVMENYCTSEQQEYLKKRRERPNNKPV